MTAHTNHSVCGPDCRYRSLYEGSQRSLTDMASRQAHALGRVGALRNTIVMAMKRTWPAQFADAEIRSGRRMQEVDDTELGMWLGQFLAARPSSWTEVAELADAVAGLGVDTDGVDTVAGLIATVRAHTAKAPPVAVEATPGPARRQPLRPSAAALAALYDDTPDSSDTNDDDAVVEPVAGGGLDDLFDDDDNVTVGAPEPTTVAPVGESSGGLDDLFDDSPDGVDLAGADTFAPDTGDRPRRRRNRRGRRRSTEAAPTTDTLDLEQVAAAHTTSTEPVVVPDNDPSADGGTDHDVIEGSATVGEEVVGDESTGTDDVAPADVEATGTSDTGVYDDTTPETGESDDHTEAPDDQSDETGPDADADADDTGADEDENPAKPAQTSFGGMRPQLFADQKKKTRPGRRVVRTTAQGPTPNTNLDVPIPDHGGELTDELRDQLMAMVCIPRPVFTSDLEAAVGADITQAWCAEMTSGPERNVGFVSAKSRHHQRGSLVVPRNDARIVQSEFTRSLWAECIIAQRGARLYEMGVLIHRFGEDIISSKVSPHTTIARLTLPRGLVGVVCVTAPTFSGDVAATLVEDLSQLMGERLVEVCVLATNEPHLGPITQAVSDAATERKWAPTMPVTLSLSWEFANGSGAATALL